MSDIELIHSFRSKDSNGAWSNWNVTRWTPIDHPLGIAQLVAAYNNDRSWLPSQQDHRLQVGIRLGGGDVIEITEEKLEGLL